MTDQINQIRVLALYLRWAPTRKKVARTLVYKCRCLTISCDMRSI